MSIVKIIMGLSVYVCSEKAGWITQKVEMQGAVLIDDMLLYCQLWITKILDSLESSHTQTG